MNHEYKFEVRGYELDSFNHVNNAVYVNYLEESRWRFFKDENFIDFMLGESLHAVVIETNIRYLRELKIFDKAIIKSKWRYDGAYMIADQNIYIQGTNKKIAKATVKMILVSSDRIMHEVPEFMINKFDEKVTV
ncbi:acyl-CoA thioesterase [Clostridium estertheticum]|uniref:acyl-CoA thioesterase n=1 Tax=Clostridium estertheticum TaxID=238834 RepID=UPI00217E0D7A|nr:thioesterase family protein [Clostridium estertheticum]